MRMNPVEACSLCLIGGVANMPALRARASATDEFTNEGKPLRLAA